MAVGRDDLSVGPAGDAQEVEELRVGYAGTAGGPVEHEPSETMRIGEAKCRGVQCVVSAV
jgi:hypothetical protein